VSSADRYMYLAIYATTSTLSQAYDDIVYFSLSRRQKYTSEKGFILSSDVLRKKKRTTLISSDSIFILYVNCPALLRFPRSSSFLVACIQLRIGYYLYCLSTDTGTLFPTFFQKLSLFSPLYLLLCVLCVTTRSFICYFSFRNRDTLTSEQPVWFFSAACRCVQHL
jgi:hypothetical protein